MIRLKKLLEDIPMGNVAFGESPRMADYQDAPRENNTEAENELKKLLVRWFGGTPGPVGSQGEFSGMIGNELYNLKSDLLKLKKEFPKVFDVPSNFKVAFRGTSIDNSYETVYDYMKSADLVYVVQNHGRYYSDPVFVIPYDYKPKSNVQSWSIRESVAETFAETGTFKLVLVTDINDLFVLNPAASNILSNIPESETLHFGKDLKTYLSVGTGATRMLQLMYEVVVGYKPGSLDDDDTTNFYDALFDHPNFKTKCKVVPNYDSLPW